MTELNTIGERIAYCRRQRIWRVAELAYKAGMNPSDLERIESGEIKAASMTVLKLANALGASLDFLLHGKTADVDREIVRDAAGQPVGLAIRCRGRSTERHYCGSCHKPASLQCDYPVKRAHGSQTCDRWTCPACATRVGPDCDYCKPHADAARAAGDPLVLNAQPKTNDIAAGEYRAVTAKYPGTCGRCGEPISIDDPIYWHPGTALCRECGEELSARREITIAV